MALLKIHLANPRTGQRKWYLLSSPMVFFFAGLFFLVITRKLCAGVTVCLLLTATYQAQASARLPVLQIGDRPLLER